jgi:Flp pilus assembly protein TadG
MMNRQRSQAVTEFAFVLPIFMLLVFGIIQLSLIFVAYYSETRMARESARWLAINHNSVDTDLAQHVSDTMLPGMLNGAITQDSTSNNADAYYHVGNMDVKFTACNPTITLPTPAGPCLNTNRDSGQTIYVELHYNVSNLIFLPTNFRLGPLSTRIPTTLPGYRISIMVE